MTYRCWWFGINNANKPKHHSHVIFAKIQPLLSGTQEEFEWPYHKQAKKHYELMNENDKVVYWMGDGGPYLKWGILGVGFISKIRGEDLRSKHFILKASYVPSTPLMPYPSKQIQETEETNFLKDVFGLSFPPLGKTFNNLGYNTTRAVVTIAEIRIEQYERVLQRLQMHPNSLKTGEYEISYAEEISEGEEKSYYEGAIHRVAVNAYERNREARQKCIDYYGVNCIVCGFNFHEKYGDIGNDFIHIHHLRQLAEIGREYQIDPIQDLRPVCPNCHQMLHRHKPPFTIEELRSYINKCTKRGR
jgi:hypothetical protein